MLGSVIHRQLGNATNFGTGAATNSTEDIYHSDLFLVIGANPTNAHPVTGAKIKQQVMKGKKLIVLDPVETELAKLADYHIEIKTWNKCCCLKYDVIFYC